MPQAVKIIKYIFKNMSSFLYKKLIRYIKVVFINMKPCHKFETEFYTFFACLPDDISKHFTKRLTLT
jgi:hypothetical protein